MNDNLNNTLATLVSAIIDKSPSLLEGARLEAIIAIIIGFVSLGAIAGLAYLVYLSIKKAWFKREDNPSDDLEVYELIFLVITSLLILIFGIMAFASLFDSANWVGLFHPETYLMLKLNLHH